MWQTHARTADDTRALGEALGKRAFQGTVVALEGDLGAGKTVFAKGVGAGLGVTTRVTSPTFVLVQAHEGGRLPLWHADLYRLGDSSELDAVGLPEVLGDGVVLVEWADRFPELLPADHLRVQLVEEGEGRRVTVTATGPRHAALEVLGG
jgi:tRNA threonylcarbamoyladenosine biosynthesis protein TsaE